MKKKITAIGLAIGLALCIALVAIPTSAQAAEEFSTATPTATTPAAEALEGIVVRVKFVDFTYTMPSGRNPGPLSDQWYITGTVTNGAEEKIAEERSGIVYFGESGNWLDLVIWKDIPKKRRCSEYNFGCENVCPRVLHRYKS